MFHVELGTHPEMMLDVIENMEAMVRVVDDQDRIAFMNRKMRDEFGNKTGLACGSIFCQKDKCVDCVATRCKVSRQPEAKDLVVGTSCYRVIATPFSLNGNENCAIEIFHDITKEKEIEETAQRHYEKLKADIVFAKQIQERFLPKDGEYGDALWLDSAYLPSEDLGGDLFDLVSLSEEKLLFYMADVSGHGVRSSLLTIFLRQVIRGMKEGAGDLNALLTELIRSYEDLNPDGEQYFSVLCGVYDKVSRRLTLVNAGHNCPPLILRKDGKIEEIAITGLPVCSLLRCADHEQKSFVLEKGDRVLICTDGVTEARNRVLDRSFGMEGVLQMVEAYKNDRDELADRIVAAAAAFSGDLPEDDMSVIILEVLY